MTTQDAPIQGMEFPPVVKLAFDEKYQTWQAESLTDIQILAAYKDQAGTLQWLKANGYRQDRGNVYRKHAAIPPCQWMVFTPTYPKARTCLYVQTVEALMALLVHFAPLVTEWTVTGRMIDLTKNEAAVRTEMENLMPGGEIK